MQPSDFSPPYLCTTGTYFPNCNTPRGNSSRNHRSENTRCRRIRRQETGGNVTKLPMKRATRLTFAISIPKPSIRACSFIRGAIWYSDAGDETFEILSSKSERWLTPTNFDHFSTHQKRLQRFHSIKAVCRVHSIFEFSLTRRMISKLTNLQQIDYNYQ